MNTPRSPHTHRCASTTSQTVTVKGLRLRKLVLLIAAIGGLIGAEPGRAQALNRFVDGEKIVLQDRQTGNWLGLWSWIPSVSLRFNVAGIEDDSVFTVRIQSDGAIHLEDMNGMVLPLQGSPESWNVFPYDPQTSTPNRAESTALATQIAQLKAQELQERGYLIGDDITALGTIAVRPIPTTAYHIQGMAKLNNGSLVVSHSTANKANNDGDGATDPELVVINPYSGVVIGGQQINSIGSEGYVSGMQACGNYLAVAAAHIDGDGKVTGASIRFFRAPDHMELFPFPYIDGIIDNALSPAGSITDPFGTDIPKRVENVGFTYVKSLDLYFCVAGRGGESMVFTSPPPATPGGPFNWTKRGGAKGEKIRFGEAGIALITETGTNDLEGYVLALGNDGVGTETFFDYSMQRVHFSATSLTVDAPDYYNLDPGIGQQLDPLGPGFRWGGTACINESGLLEIFASARNIEDTILGTALQFKKWRPLAAGKVVKDDLKTRGEIISVKCVETSESGDDEVYLIWDGGGAGVVEMEDDETWTPNFGISSPSADGTHVYVMEEDSRSPDDVLGEIFIPAPPYALPGVHEYTAKLTGDDGTYLVTYSITANTPPVADAGGPYAVNEGGAVKLDGTGSSDAEGDPLTYAWDLDNDGEFDDATGPTPTFSAASLDDGSYTVRIRVSDGQDFTDHAAIVTVVNVAPTITATGDVIDEDGVATVRGAFTDPGRLDTFTVTIDWGDGSSLESRTYPARADLGPGSGNTTLFSISHPYPDDNPTGTASDLYPIAITVTDDDLGSGNTATAITVNDVAPVVATAEYRDETGSLIGVDTGFALVGLKIDVATTFTDVGAVDTHEASIDWGDGSCTDATLIQGAGSGSLSASHVWSRALSAVVNVTVTDDDTLANTNTNTVVVLTPLDALAALAELVSDLVADTSLSLKTQAGLTRLLGDIWGNQGGASANGAFDKLLKGNLNATMVKLGHAVSSIDGLLRAPDLKPDQIALLAQLNRSLALTAKSIYLDAAGAVVVSRPNDLRKISEAAAVATAADLALRSGNIGGAVDYWIKAVQQISPMIPRVPKSESVNPGNGIHSAKMTQLPDRKMQLEIQAMPGDRFSIEASSDLLGWQPIATKVADSEGIIRFVDPQGAKFSTRYFRAVRK